MNIDTYLADSIHQICKGLAVVYEAIAWPFTALVLAAVFRDSIVALLERIEFLRAGNAAASFRRLLKQAEDTSKDVPELLQAQSSISPTEETSPSANDTEAREQPQPARPKRVPSHGELANLATQNPAAAIFEAWVKVEQAARFALRRAGLTMITTNSCMNELLAMDLLDWHGVRLVQQLSTLRNQVVHGSYEKVTVSQALIYVELVDRLVAYLEGRPRLTPKHAFTIRCPRCSKVTYSRLEHMEFNPSNLEGDYLSQDDKCEQCGEEFKVRIDYSLCGTDVTINTCECCDSEEVEALIQAAVDEYHHGDQGGPEPPSPPDSAATPGNSA